MNAVEAKPAPAVFWFPSIRLAAVLIVAVMLLLPIWTAAFPPLLDYPNHLARAFVLSHLRDPSFSFGQFYRSDWGPYPYLGMDALLAVLARLFPIETAGRFYLSLCVLAFPAAAWFFLRQAQPKSGAGFLWSLLIAYNVFFLEGFLNFDLSIAVGLFALGLWLRWLRKPDTFRWIAALVAFTAAYFTQLLGFALAGVMVVAFLALSRRPVRDWLWSAALGAPGMAF